MRRLACALPWLLVAIMAPAAAARDLGAFHIESRSKPGPVTMRGVAAHVSSRGFILQTTRHGTYQVVMSGATAVVEKGKSGHLSVAEGDTVGVRGFVAGNEIRAIRTPIYPTKFRGPKPFSARGTVSSVHGSDLLIAVGGKTVRVHVPGGTEILIGSATGSLGQVRVGDRVDVRVQQTGSVLSALHVHVYRSQTPQRHVEVRGTVVTVGSSGMTVASGSQRVQIGLSAKTQVYDGATPSSLRNLRTGENVTVHTCCAGHALSAISVHILKAPPGKHVELSGTVTGISSTSLTVASGSHRYGVNVSSQTHVYYGVASVTRSTLKSGQSVTIHACCSGRPLTAISIHIRKVSTRRSTITVRGQVVAITASQIRIGSSHGATVGTLQSSTIYEVGSSSVSRGGVQVGDVVSLKAYRSGSTLNVERVHVYAEYRRQHTVDGVVASITRSGIVVDARGKRYTVNSRSGTSVSLDGKPASLGAVHVGDRVKAIGRMDASGAILATSISVRRLPPKKQTVSGMVVQVSGTSMVVVDSFGRRQQVRLPSNGYIYLHGKPAPAAALFPGVKVTAHGTMSGGTLEASTVTLEVKTRSLSGRVAGVSGGGRFSVALTSGETVAIDLAPGAVIADNAAHGGRGAIHAAAYVTVQGYVEQSGAVRAITVQVLHPTLAISATVVSVSGGLTIQTSRGERYRLHLSSGIQVTVERADIALSPQYVPIGATVHVEGMVRSDGTLAVSQLVVRLPSVTLRGKVTTTPKQTFSLDTGTGSVEVRTNSGTTFAQGTHVLANTDVVVGDDVSIYGYQAGSGTILARKVLVHRRLVGMDGTVQSTGPDGFSLQAADGPHEVIVSSATIFSGGTSADLAAGASVHVTGYLRGDGAILAIRVRLGKKRLTRISRIEQVGDTKEM